MALGRVLRDCHCAATLTYLHTTPTLQHPASRGCGPPSCCRSRHSRHCWDPQQVRAARLDCIEHTDDVSLESIARKRMSAPTLSPESNTFFKEALHWRYSSGTDAVFLGQIGRGDTYARARAQTHASLELGRACLLTPACTRHNSFKAYVCVQFTRYFGSPFPGLKRALVQRVPTDSISVLLPKGASQVKGRHF